MKFEGVYANTVTGGRGHRLLRFSVTLILFTINSFINVVPRSSATVFHFFFSNPAVCLAHYKHFHIISILVVTSFIINYHSNDISLIIQIYQTNIKFVCLCRKGHNQSFQNSNHRQLFQINNEAKHISVVTVNPSHL